MDRYIRKKKIGEGSFGTALLVQSKADGKNYVIKEINISKMKRKEKEEAKKEVSVLRKMKHPNIVSYTESFEELGNLYIVMDYCDGGDLYQRINARRGALIPEDQIMDWFVQICLALKHVHDRKILHRDIKSQNIFLTSRGIIKIGDFGIARVLNNTMELARTCIGTPYYLSPEICENKPYNNKSDIWALGCVLYELCTLKHAFEAGNMKNLVLKIIRGSYPPVAPKYSYDLRNLINQLFKRNPRDRPSVNTILKKNFIMKRIRKYLTDAQLEDEFSHTVLHKGMPPPKAAVKRPVDKVSEGVRISGPAAKYGAPMMRKKPPIVRKSSAERERRSSQPDLEQKKKELLAKEKERRNKEMHFKAQKQKLVDRQKMLQIRKAREAGWKHTLSSNSSNGSLGGSGGGMGGGLHQPPARPLPQPNLQPLPRAGNEGNYDHYHQYLDNLQAKQNVEGGIGNVALFREDRDAMKRQILERPASASAAEAARRAEVDRNIAVNAADRAAVVSEFLLRKRQAEAYKIRAGFQMGWNPLQDVPPDRPQPQYQEVRNVGGNQDYLEKLKAIRMQNFKERQLLQQRHEEAEGKCVKYVIDEQKVDADSRRKKIEALKAQADERAAKLKEQLERQRREMYEREQKQWQEHLARKKNQEKVEKQKNMAGEIRPAVGPSTPGVSMTGVLQDVGVNIKTAAPQKPEPVEPPSSHEQPESQLAAERKKWGGGDGKNLNLARLPLQETASNMEVTSAADVVTKYEKQATVSTNKTKAQPSPQIASEEKGDPPSQAPRKKWGAPVVGQPVKESVEDQAIRKKWASPGSTVLGVLQNAEIQATTMTISSGEGDHVNTQASGPLGVTMVKKKGTTSPTAVSKTIVIKEKGVDSDNVEIVEAKDEDIVKDKPETANPKTAWSEEVTSDLSNGAEGKSNPDANTVNTEENSKDASKDDTSEAGVDSKDGRSEVDSAVESKDGRSEVDSAVKSRDGRSEVDSGVESRDGRSEVDIGVDSRDGRSEVDTNVIPESPKQDVGDPVVVMPSLPVVRPLSAPSSRDGTQRYEETDIDAVDEKQKTEENKEKQVEQEIDIPDSSLHVTCNDDISKSSVTNSNDSEPCDSTSVRDAEIVIGNENSLKNDQVLSEEQSQSHGTEKMINRKADDEALVSKVNLEDEDSEQEDTAPESQNLQKSGAVVSGLTVGTFDADSRLLRTCSLPDLSKLFRTTLAFNPFFEVEQQVLAAAAQTLNIVNTQEDEETLSDGGDEAGSGETEQEEDDGDDDDEEEDDEEEAYQSMVESMKHLLEAVDADGTEDAEGRASPEGTTPRSPAGDDISQAEEEDERLDEAAGESKPINEDWDSGEGSYDDDGELDDFDQSRRRHSEADDEDSESVFFRLEESRMELERQLGCDNFLKAYKAVQAIHEDEDENIEEGTMMVRDILGWSKQHLYTKILQLVMADGAYTEDNE
ncbi:serine/threonine-protein kinase Nek1-like isoform X3 [Apostichopus japonicus]|uniref:serine/threonine-protein kinase Nek1-like isoform X3 n=1 Tax=Stichopus japonicus TaxID=307972 RepID=UPI003AB14D9D